MESKERTQHKFIPLWLCYPQQDHTQRLQVDHFKNKIIKGKDLTQNLTWAIMIYYHVNKRKLQMIWIFMKMMKTMRYQDQGLIIMPILRLVSKILKKMKISNFSDQRLKDFNNKKKQLKSRWSDQDHIILIYKKFRGPTVKLLEEERDFHHQKTDLTALKILE